MLNVGSRDKGPNGPVRYLQNILFAWRPRLARAFELVPDGDYGDVTKKLIMVLQDEADPHWHQGAFVVDGNFGPATRAYILDGLLVLDLDAIPFAEGGACVYIDDEGNEQLWDPIAAAAHGAAGEEQLELMENAAEHPDQHDIVVQVPIGEPVGVSAAAQ